MEDNAFQAETFKKMIDFSPMGATLWEAGNPPEDWERWTLIYCNNRIRDFLGVDISGFVGLKASDFPKGFGQESFDPLFRKVIETEEAQVTMMEFGGDILPEASLQFHLIPLNKRYMATFYSNVTPQVESKDFLSGKIADLEEVNRYMISREIKIASFAREIERLQRELKRLEE